jgi:Glycosyltransferase like family 2
MTGVSYVLPLRWADDAELDDLLAYLRTLADHAEVIVVDGSAPEHFERHAHALAGVARHLPPASLTPMGKVGGVHTGVEAASHDRVVIADDDVRYEPEQLAQVAALLDLTDLVRPQNVFVPAPWHARWDTSRSLINRALGGDFPGTLAVRRSFFLAIGGYDGDVMFENLELIRTVRAAGGGMLTPLDVFVARRPPTARRFFEQRVRQAYDDLAMPARLAASLALAPAVALSPRRAGPAAVALSVALAEAGRRRGGGTQAFPRTAALWAPLWVAERAVCSWLAVGSRLRGGVRYGDGRLRRAGSSPRALRRRFAARPLAVAAPARGRARPRLRSALRT